MSKSKVLSIRISLEALQSCFDICLLNQQTAKGASSAMARTLEILTRDLRARQVIPSYSQAELHYLLQSYLGGLNPVSMSNLDQANTFDSTNSDFMPSPFKIENFNNLDCNESRELLPESKGEHGLNLEKVEKSEFAKKSIIEAELDKHIKEIQKESEQNLLSQILIGGSK